MPLALRFNDGLGRTLSYLEHVALWVVAVTGPKATCVPLFGFGADLSTKLGRPLAGHGNGRYRQAQLDRCVLTDPRG